MTPPPSTILIVDDEPRALVFLRNLIEPEGYRVVTAANGAEAIQVALHERPDVALLDVMMPELDGFEVCRRMRAEAVLRPMPVLMLTALDDRTSRLRGLEAGADDFLCKPVDSAELRIRLRTITRLNRFRLLYDERARFEAAVAFAPDGIVLTEEDGRILLANEAAGRLVADPAGLTGNFFAQLPEATVARLLRHLGEPAAGGHRMVETALLQPRTPGTTLEITIGRMPWEARTILQFNLRDITEKKSLEEQLLHSQRIEVLGQLAGGIVHDVNNIFTAIMGSASLIEMGDAARTPIHLANIFKSSQRGANVLRQLLLFARGSDGTLEPVNPAGVAAEVVNVVRETFGPSYRIAFATAERLPPVRADANQLYQIVMNLCVNARDAMPEGGDLTVCARHVELTSAQAQTLGQGAQPGEFVELSVRDTGTGIPPEIRAKLFEPFFTTKPPGKGTGLGLAMVLRLVRRHQGFVLLETEVGKGTCFACHFPVAAAAVPA